MMHHSHRKSVWVGLGLLCGLASQASAVILYDGQGFEAPTYTTGAGGGGAFLAGQPNALPPNDPNRWVNAPTSATNSGNIPSAVVYPYLTPTAPNFQFVQVAAPNVLATNANSFYPQTNVAAPFTPAVNEAVAITFTMTVLSGANDPFFGITAYGGANGASFIAQIGLDGTTGNLVGPSGPVTPAFNVPLGTPMQYQLQLNYTTKTYTLLTAPAVINSSYTIRGTGPFATLGATTFTDADIATFALAAGGGANYSGAANFDNYLVQTVSIPEPAVLGLGAAAFGLLASRRRQHKSA